MDLRLTLLLVGVFVIVAIILDGIRRKKNITKQLQAFDSDESASFNVSDSSFAESDPLFLEMEELIVREPKIKPKARKENQDVPPQEVITLTLMPIKQPSFAGRAVHAAFQSHQFKFGQMRIFHKHRADQVDGDVLFSIASVTEPGTFEPNKLVTSQIKGLTLFMVMSQTHDPLVTYEKMVATARHMAHTLQASICDKSRATLSSQGIEHTKELIREFQRKSLTKEKVVDF